MRKKAIDEPKPEYPPAPTHLSERAAALWRELGPWRADTLGRRTLFQAALEALDRAEQARELIETAGLVSATKTTGALHIHPAVKVEREARAQFAAIWTQLGLTQRHDSLNSILGM